MIPWERLPWAPQPTMTAQNSFYYKPEPHRIGRLYEMWLIYITDGNSLPRQLHMELGFVFIPTVNQNWFTPMLAPNSTFSFHFAPNVPFIDGTAVRARSHPIPHNLEIINDTFYCINTYYAGTSSGDIAKVYWKYKEQNRW